VCERERERSERERKEGEKLLKKENEKSYHI